ncbi:endonuclease/exonuclease/phosphatase family protein [Poriferisphaera sp. WC338]|uniref:endonuclease/exonuclease/phosphatase family protein n=1 Tax=Poriferisphaera sp. WC338 TaxID=3425129 RepID=UPI003D815768
MTKKPPQNFPEQPDSRHPIDDSHPTPDHTKPTLAQRIFRPIVIILFLGGYLAIAGTIIGFFGRWWWVLDLFANFRLQYTYPLLAALITAAIRQKWLPATLFLLALLINTSYIAALYQSQQPITATNLRPLKILHLNLNRTNNNTDAVVKLFHASDADLIFLQEATAPWLSALMDQTGSYQLELPRPRPDAFGIALFVNTKPEGNFKLRTTRILDMTPSAINIPAIEAVVESDDRVYSVLSLHALPPVSAHHSKVRNTQLHESYRWAIAQEHPAIIIGDFNATPFAYPMREIIYPSDPDAPNLNLAQQGQGYRGSWPAPFPAPLRIPIDHALLTPDLAITHYALGNGVGSDHLPLIVHVRSIANQSRIRP